MKTIDLLNKIANGEEVPKRIRYINSIWEYNEETKDYIHDDLWLIYSMNSIGLTLEVEVIEDNKKIEKLNKKHFHKKQRQLANKINEIIDKLNEVLNDKN